MPAVEADYPLAKIVRIVSKRAIPGAISVEVYEIAGWQLVSRIGDFEIGSYAIYFSINTVFPDLFEHDTSLSGLVLKTKKIRGELSQGLLAPITWLSASAEITEDKDYTNYFKLKKWVPDSEGEVYLAVGEEFPDSVPKTDEPRVQNITAMLAGMKDRKICITEKMDGTSATYILNNCKFDICGRNYINPKGHYMDICKMYDIENKMMTLGRNLAIQGEIIGPKINNNNHKVKNYSYHVFNIYDIDKSSYLLWDDIVSICEILGLNTVKVLFRGVVDVENLNHKYFLEMADSHKYAGSIPAEGVVVKTDDNAASRISFKAISNSRIMREK